MLLVACIVCVCMRVCVCVCVCVDLSFSSKWTSIGIWKLSAVVRKGAHLAKSMSANCCWVKTGDVASRVATQHVTFTQTKSLHRFWVWAGHQWNHLQPPEGLDKGSVPPWDLCLKRGPSSDHTATCIGACVLCVFNASLWWACVCVVCVRTYFKLEQGCCSRD